VAFGIEPGEVLGIIGPSGAGKSTLARHIVGVLSPSAGAVRLDGSDVSVWARTTLGQHLGYLPQDIELFADTIAANISRFQEGEDKEAILAAQMAGVHDMIVRLPNGYDTQVGEGGAILSGGYRQRIGLARAVYGNPSLVVLDEPSSNLDADGDAALTDCIMQLKQRGTTVVIISHRPSTIGVVDKILLLKDGVAEMFGPRAEVMARLTRAVPVHAVQGTASSEQGMTILDVTNREMRLGAISPGRKISSGDDAPSDSIRRVALAGWLIIAVFFGGIGSWAATAPLNGAVVGNAVVKVDGNRKSVQHLDGGIVKELRIKEGDKVNAGDILVVLDETQAQAEYDVLSQQYMVLRATEVRLLTELDRGTELVMPQDLKARPDDSYFKSVWNGQVSQFQSRLAAIEGQRSVIREKINQLGSQITGAQAQVKSFTDQITSVHAEAKDIAPLVERGLIARPRILQLERTAFGLEGQIADANANIAKARQAIAEQQQQIAQLDNDRMADITKDLRDTQAKMLEVIPKAMNAKAVLGRMEIRSPYAGRVVALTVFSVGGVIQRGEKILDIVPDQDSLTIEAQIAVEDISDIKPNMRAEVHLTAYKQRIVPIIHGDVIQVSADRLTDPKTNNPYYIAFVRVDQDELAAMPNIKLYPGMPATVMIPTIQRTAFDYIVGPLVMSFNHSFRQK
jgi:HlyD family type I secretion membrane fusion protein